MKNTKRRKDVKWERDKGRVMEKFGQKMKEKFGKNQKLLCNTTR